MKRIITAATLATLATLTLATGCTDKADDTGMGTITGDAGTTADGGTADGGTADGGTDAGTADGGTEGVDFTLTGNAVDVASSMPAAAGLCIAAINPDGAVTGGDTVTMVSGKLGDNGAFSLAGVDAKPAFGILISVFDCADAGSVLTTATPVLPSSYTDIEVGGEISGLTVFSVGAAYADGMDASLAAVGYSGSIWTDGGLMGGVWDSTYTPLDGATVTGASTVYYQDADSSDGLYSTGGAMNTVTDKTAGAIFLIPAAPIGGYSAALDGYTFSTNTLGSSPGSVIFAPVIAD